MNEVIFVLWFLNKGGFPTALAEFETREECVVESRQNYWLRCIKTRVKK